MTGFKCLCGDKFAISGWFVIKNQSLYHSLRSRFISNLKLLKKSGRGNRWKNDYIAKTVPVFSRKKDRWLSRGFRVWICSTETSIELFFDFFPCNIVTLQIKKLKRTSFVHRDCRQRWNIFLIVFLWLLFALLHTPEWDWYNHTRARGRKSMNIHYAARFARWLIKPESAQGYWTRFDVSFDVSTYPVKLLLMIVVGLRGCAHAWCRLRAAVMH